MDPHRTGPPALSHSGSMGPQVDHHHSVPYLEVPTATAPGWWSILAGTGMPRRNSVGFSENYVSDTAPPFCLDDDSNPPTNSKNTLVPPPVFDASNRSPPIRRRRSPLPSDVSPMEIPSPSDEFLNQFWSKHHGSGALETSLVEGSAASKIAVVVSHCDDDGATGTETLIYPSSNFHSKAVSRPITAKLAGSIHLEDFPVATHKSLSELDVLKKEILASDFEEKNKNSSTTAFDQPSRKKLSEPDQRHAFQMEASDVEKPPSKLVSYLLSQPFAQNWFFRNADSTSTETEPPLTDEAHRKQAERRTQQQAERLKGFNVWAPQNL